MARKKMNDGIRILAGLREGCAVYHAATYEIGWGHFSHHYVEAPDGRHICVSYAAISRAEDAGYIERGAAAEHHFDTTNDRYYCTLTADGRRVAEHRADLTSYSHFWILTANGRAAAAALPAMTVDEIIVRPEARKKTPEQIESERCRQLAKTAVNHLIIYRDSSGARMLGNQMLKGRGYLQPPDGSLYDPLPEAVMDVIRPLLEKFTGTDGVEYMRISEAGIAAARGSNFKYRVTKGG